MATRRRGSGVKRQLVFSKCHPGRPCSSCALCGKTDTYFMNWKPEEKAFVARHYKNELADNICICRADHLEAKRNHSNHNYLPKWKKQEQVTVTAKCCIYPDCSVNTKLIAPAFESIDNLEALISVQSSSENPFLVCQQHYHAGTVQKNSHSQTMCMHAVELNRNLANPLVGIAQIQKQCPCT